MREAERRIVRVCLMCILCELWVILERRGQKNVVVRKYGERLADAVVEMVEWVGLDCFMATFWNPKGFKYKSLWIIDSLVDRDPPSPDVLDLEYRV
jgi:hypothetical protein